MPYTPKQHRFFALCATHPEKAKGKCPSKSDAKRMMGEGVKHKKSFPKKDSRGYY